MSSIHKNYLKRTLSSVNKLNKRILNVAQYIEYIVFSTRLFKQTFYGKDVALVGNAASLVASLKGTQIDSHQLVVRFNIGLTEGRESDVGNRTDIRFLGLTLKENLIGWSHSS